MRFPAVIACGLLLGCQFDPSGIGRDGGGGDDDVDGAPADAVGPETPDAPPGGPDGAPRAHWFKTITIDGTRVPGALTDFPVYVAIDDDDDLRTRATAGGTDLHFTSAGGVTVLDHEIQRWSQSAGLLEAWVRVPALASGSNTVLELHYGADAEVVAQDPAGVWSNGFVAVWHLEEEPGAAGSILDALGGSHGTPSGSMSADDLVAGVLGNGMRFSGGSDEVTFTNPLLGASSHTISAWVDQQVIASNDALVVLGNGACNQARWFHTRFTNGPLAAGFYCDDFDEATTDIQGDGPTLLHWTYDTVTSETRIYRDGTLAELPHTHGGEQSTVGSTGRIGNAPAAFGTSMGLNAVADEIRIATTPRAAAWVATEHANQSSPATFYGIGPEQPAP